jgi:hypothetical protein
LPWTLAQRVSTERALRPPANDMSSRVPSAHGKQLASLPLSQTRTVIRVGWSAA